MSSGSARKLAKLPEAASDKNEEEVAQLTFNFEDLLHVLYGKKQGNTVDLLQLQEERTKQRPKTYCVVCHVDRAPNLCPFHDPSFYTADQDDNSLSYAIKSFPAEVQLCTSTIPGALFGVCAKRVIPEGTWIGPYEGRRVNPEELLPTRDNSYVWEIYIDGQPSYYIDGSDESTSSWMRFIRCARHKEEQNLFAFQYLGNIFYRSFQEISKGTEMLVWYDEKYPQYLGVPTGLQQIEFVSSSDLTKASNGDKTRHVSSVKAGGEIRHPAKQEKDKAREGDINRQPEDQHLRVEIYPEPYPRINTGPSPHRLRHFPYQTVTRISGAPHSIISSAGFPTPNNASVLDLSSQGVLEAIATPHYTHPVVPIAPSLLSTIPSSVYGISYEARAPVNISAGIPAGISARGQLEITGTPLPRVREEVMVEGPVIISGNSSVYSERHTGTSLQTDDSNTLEQDGSTQRKRIYVSSTAVETEALDEVGRLFPSHAAQPQPHSPIYTSRRQAVEGTADSFAKRKSPSSNRLDVIKEDNRPHTPKARSLDDQLSDRKPKNHRLHTSNDDHAPSSLQSKRSRLTSAWPSDESQSQDEATGESSDSNSTTSSLKNEGTSIDEISMWRCRQCQKTFTQRALLQVHVCPHQPLKPYRCGQCELSFASSIELRGHVETHASEKPFKCGYCSRSFAGATTLNNHVRTHMGKRPFNCERCGKCFAQAGQLARHHRTPGECETSSNHK